VVEISLGWLREAGRLTVSGATYALGREGLMSGAFFLEGDLGRVATARKPNAFTRSFEVSIDRRNYVFRASAPIVRTFVLERGGKVVGTVRPVALLSRRAVADLPEDMPLPARVFLVWLVLLMWRRASRNS